MKALFLTFYGPIGASSRIRYYQFFPMFEAAGIECTASPLVDDEVLLQRYRTGKYKAGKVAAAYMARLMLLTKRHRFDAIVVEKEIFPWVPSWITQSSIGSVPYVVDFDDAVFHKYDQHRSSLFGKVYDRQVDRVMSGARLVLVGNEYLAAHARAAGASWIEIVPTVIDLDRYSIASREDNPATPIIVWIGSPSTVRYLSLVADAFAALRKRRVFTLRVIGLALPNLPDVDVEFVRWTADTEAARIAECDIGIMPLEDTPWEKGKCAYKLIQYMACGLPTVSSPVGANLDVVRSGETGFFADTPDAWVEKLEALLANSQMRKRLGSAGRARVEQHYCLQQIMPRLSNLLKRVGGQ
jgi:glycosyltransferase involved in cell wall biosynthesis